MLSHLLTFVVMGLVQLALAVYGVCLAVKSLPPGEKRRPHLLGISFLGLLAVILTVWIGVQTYQSEKQAENVQTELKGNLAAANQKLENQTGQLTTIAEMLRVNSNDPAVLATALAQVLHPPQKSPCLNPARFSVRQRQSPSGYETLIQISNPTGIGSGTTFMLFFNTRVVSIQSLEVRYGSASSGSDTPSITIAEDVPKGKPLMILAGGSPQPAQVRCVDRFNRKR
jgi:hypothetical protein